MVPTIGENDTTKVPKPSAKAVASGMVIALHSIFAFDGQYALLMVNTLLMVYSR